MKQGLHPLAMIGLLVAATLFGRVLPTWTLSLATVAASNALIALGIVVLARTGNVSFGQGLFFATGGYGVALIASEWGITDAVVQVIIGAVCGGLLGLVIGPLIARYSGIFFGMLVRENNLRVEYLGISANRIVTINFVIAAIFAGASGAFALMAQRHIDPQFAYWTTSGEFVFVAVLAGYQSVAAVFVASLALELVRSFSNLYLPNTWQLVLGVFLLGVILFLPRGIGSLWVRDKRKRSKPTIEDPITAEKGVAL